MKRPCSLALGTALAAACLSVVPASAQGEPEVLDAIVEEGKNHSQVWQHLEYLCHNIGPRLTGSAKLEQANVWTRAKFQEFGLTNSHLFKWGEMPVRFDRGPSSARMISPEIRDFEFSTPAWGAGTNGPVTASVIKEPTTLEELEAVKGELAGALILAKPSQRRRRGGGNEEQDDEARQVRETIQAAIAEAGILGRLRGSRNDQVTTYGRGWQDLTMDTLPTQVEVNVRRIDYDAINSKLADGDKVEVELDLVHYFTEGPHPIFNTIAEIKGTEFPEQVVIVSAHLDSWNGPGSQGCQDNGTGSMVTLEAARILTAVGVKPRRTIRFCLWSGEEQGLYGSKGYVASLSDEEKANISACFVDDGGTRYQGGLVCTEEMLPMLEAATARAHEAFPDMPIAHNVVDELPRRGASDHSSFIQAGIPGFFWIEKGKGGQDEKTYGYVWHTQNDTTYYAVEENLIQSATCSAITAYNLAMADTLLPRPQPKAEATEQKTVEAAAPAAGFEVVEGPLAGAWIGKLTDDEVPAGNDFTFTLEHGKNGGLRGEIKADAGTGKIAGTWMDEKLAFDFDTDAFGKLKFRATLKDGKLVGAIEAAGGMQIDWEASRDAAKKKD